MILRFGYKLFVLRSAMAIYSLSYCLAVLWGGGGAPPPPPQSLRYILWRLKMSDILQLTSKRVSSEDYISAVATSSSGSFSLRMLQRRER